MYADYLALKLFINYNVGQQLWRGGGGVKCFGDMQGESLMFLHILVILHNQEMALIKKMVYQAIYYQGVMKIWEQVKF